MKNMKKTIILVAMFCLCFQAVAASAAAPDFSGEWELDASQSKMLEARIDSMIMKVSQTDKYLSVESETIMNQVLADGSIKRGTDKNTRNGVAFELDGKEKRSILTGKITGEEIKKTSFTADGKLNATTIRNLKTEAGDVVLKINEIWELLDGGNTLKITRYTESPNGAMNSEMFFKRKAAGVKTQTAGDAANTESAGVGSASGATPRKISGGVLNGKAIRMGAPEYPAAARAVKASGAVNVQVTIDEAGNVVSASAVSGHPLLKQAAEQAARGAQFAPTMLSGVPVQVTGVLVYNFVP